MKEKRNTGSRCAGVLAPVTSLPGTCGIGGFGQEAYRFVDLLKQMDIRVWQILPLNPLGYGNSPYQPFSSYAGDEIYIDLEILANEGYISSRIADYENSATDVIDYQAVRNYKEPYLREASACFWSREEKGEGFEEFCRCDWVYPYAVFIALKKQNGLRCWNEWPKEQQDWILNQNYNITHLRDEIEYQIFLQYMFLRQWKKLKEYANGRGIEIMGDVPFYVGIDSLDVWQAREDFLLDQDGRPTHVAGVPPDYFSEVGQRWGNPIYDWSNMEKNNFSFWANRLTYSSELYDIIRVDHFRAFDTYWKIPVTCDTAVEGEWLEAPGYALLDEVYRNIPDFKMVAEDLGDLRTEVLELRDHYHLAGMNIAEFSILDEKTNVTNQLIYTGTHDNQTVVGWYLALDRKSKKQVRRKLHIPYDDAGVIADRMIEYICATAADLAIIPVMDLLGLDDDARLNTPGTVGAPNWMWKMKDYDLLEKKQKWIQRLLRHTRRS